MPFNRVSVHPLIMGYLYNLENRVSVQPIRMGCLAASKDGMSVHLSMMSIFVQSNYGSTKEASNDGGALCLLMQALPVQPLMLGSSQTLSVNTSSGSYMGLLIVAVDTPPIHVSVEHTRSC